MRDGVVRKLGGALPLLLGFALLAVESGGALAQSNLDAGKTPAQIFATTCAACHRSPRELRPTSVYFLREHYSTGGQVAAAMAAYLAAVGSDARAVQQRRPPALGAGSEAALRSQTSASDPQSAPAVKLRRPSESIELGRLPVSDVPGSETAPAHAAAAPESSHGGSDAFEE